MYVKVWVNQNVNSIVSKYIRRWLEVPVSGIVSNVYLNQNKFELSIIPPSIKFTQCQSTIRNALKSSPNDSTKHLWRLTSNHTNIQYGNYNLAKKVLEHFHFTKGDRHSTKTWTGQWTLDS